MHPNLLLGFYPSVRLLCKVVSFAKMGKPFQPPSSGRQLTWKTTGERLCTLPYTAARVEFVQQGAMSLANARPNIEHAENLTSEA